MKKQKNGKFFGGHILRSRLSFDEGFAENPLYVIKAQTTEKEKGVGMIDLIKQNFGLSEDMIRQIRAKSEESFIPTEIHPSIGQHSVKLTRDEKGNLASPFRSKRRLF